METAGVGYAGRRETGSYLFEHSSQSLVRDQSWRRLLGVGVASSYPSDLRNEGLRDRTDEF